MDQSIRALGWTELEGERLTNSEIKDMLCPDPMTISRLGGEFFLGVGWLQGARSFWIMPGDCPPGTMVCGDKRPEKLIPDYPVMDLDKAIEIAVQLRSDDGVVALSGESTRPLSPAWLEESAWWWE